MNNTLASESKEMQSQLRVLYETDAYMPHPVVAHPSIPAPTRQRVLAAFVQLTQDEIGQRMLDAIGLDQPVAVNYARHYQPLEALKLDKFLVLGN